MSKPFTRRAKARSAMWAQLEDFEPADQVKILEEIINGIREQYKIDDPKAHPIDDVREEVSNFAVEMEDKLAKHDDEKGENGWVYDTTFSLLERIKDEVTELERALNSHQLKKAMGECADVGNFAMMVWDNLSNVLGQLQEEMYEEPDKTTMTTSGSGAFVQGRVENHRHLQKLEQSLHGEDEQ